MASSSKRLGLGRGLDALILGGVSPAPQSPAGGKSAPGKPAKASKSAAPAAAKPAKAAPAPAPAPAPDPVPPRDRVLRVPVSAISRSPWQPRKAFDAAALDELASSIRERGVLQPLLVREREGGKYELIAGERRFRASQLAGLSEVPVLLLSAGDKDALELALVENIQREDLNPIEEAEGYRLLAQTFSLTQEQVAERVGRARATVANALRLLDFSDPVKRAIAEGKISAGHAKVLLSADPSRRELLALRVIAQGLSVRALEKLVHATPSVRPQPVRVPPPDAASGRAGAQLRHLGERIQQQLGTKVLLTAAGRRADGRAVPGTITIEYYDDEDLTRLLEAMNLSDLG